MSHKSSEYTPKIFYTLLPVSLLFSVIGVFFIYTFLYQENRDYFIFRNADKTKISKIERVEIVYLDDGEGDPSRSVEVKYSFHYLGTEYSSTRASIYTIPDNFGSFHVDLYNKIKDAKENGTKLYCFVHPDDPSLSVIHRDLRPSRILMSVVFSVVFSLLGFGLLLKLIIYRKWYFS